ncbi:hypothetical protein D7Y11_13825 [Corallococcus sp. AB018]|uniref:DUF6603 domain-containing protein n=1 Tax=Corallococcus sp. AB018 TaxID=2316715 RepID=UPI000F87C711|nr:DUF6603 domain-containing protein [Corallococcus sp. AB018]RUO92652.1 hypothetical protein D7Y11_13825 [Corallococcus sp. AB018]
MASILTILADALREVRTGEPSPAPAVLDAIPDNPLGITVNNWDDIEEFLQAWDALQESVRDTLIVRMTQQRLPRLAEALVLLGVIRVAYVPGSNPVRVQSFTIDQERVKQLLRTHGASADDLQWWLTKATNPKKLKSLIVLLATAPKLLLALEYVNDGFQSLPGGPQSAGLGDVIDALANSPATITLPTTVHTARTFEELLHAVTHPPAETFGRVSAEVSELSPPSTVALKFRVNDVASLAATSVDLGSGWTLSFTPGAPDTGAGSDYHLEWNSTSGWNQAVRSSTDLSLEMKRGLGGGPDVVIGDEDGTRLEIGRISAAVRLSKTPGDTFFALGVQLDQVMLALEVPSVLRMLGAVASLPGSLRFKSDLSIGYSQGAGLQVRTGEAGGDGSLAVQFVHPLNLQVGGSGAGIKIERVAARLSKSLDTRDFRIELRTSATAEIGPLRLTADGAGAFLGITGGGAAAGALAPTRIGIVVDAGPVRGGGFLEVQTQSGLNSYAGVLSLRLLTLDVFAFGILKEREGGGLSFIAVLGARFPAGIQLGFGFMITGVGGIVGIHRGMDLELLRDRLASGAAGNVLFCDDPSRNAPVLLGDLEKFFPTRHGSHVVGPTLQLSWLSILRLDAALVIELPGPRAIVLAGSARATIGLSKDLALMYLRMDFIGGIDAQAELIFFDAALVDSRVLGIFDITGNMAFRLCYGARGYFALSVGGFHPSFNPAPMNFPQLARVGTSLSLSVVADIWMRTEMYLAFTSNTFQLGSAVEARLRLGPLRAHGWFKFDALIQFKPFYFQADIDAGFEITFGDVSVASARVQGQLSGPGPITLRARASIKVLFVRVSGSATFRLGPGGGESEKRLPSAREDLVAELNVRNMRSEGDDPDVFLRRDRFLQGESVNTGVLVLPNSRVVWEQKLAPLNTDLQRFRGQLLENTEHYSVSCPDLPFEDEFDQFAFGTFATLAPSEALNNALFQPRPSGLKSEMGLLIPALGKQPSLNLDLTIVPDLRKLSSVALDLASHFVPALLSKMAEQRNSVPPSDGGPGKVTVRGETWKAVARVGGTLPGNDAVSPAQAFLQARQAKGFAASVTDGKLDLTGV